MSRILIADDHPMIRTAIAMLLRDTEHEVIATVGTGDEAIAVNAAEGPDIVLLDLVMPGASGLSVARALRESPSPPKIIILTAAIDDPALMEARSLGLAGLVLKNSDPAFLIECLDKVAAGATWIDPELEERIKTLSDSFNAARRPALAPRERQLIGYVRQGLRNREIAEALGVTEGTVKVYLHNVFEKLGVATRTELAVRADEFLAESYSRS
jgi:two-component system nitrate/nitrite response regulator NarP